MVPQRNFVFADKVEGPFVSNDCVNSMSDLIDLQLSGTFTSCSVALKGKVDLNAEYETLKVINLGKLEAVSEITEAGIYEAAIGGMQSLQVEVTSVDGGYITIVGRILKEG